MKTLRIPLAHDALLTNTGCVDPQEENGSITRQGEGGRFDVVFLSFLPLTLARVRFPRNC